MNHGDDAEPDPSADPDNGGTTNAGADRAAGDTSDNDTDIVAGIHAVEALLQEQPGTCRTLLLQRGRRDRRIGELRVLAKAAGIPVQWRPRNALDRLFAGAHQGAVARIAGVARRNQRDLETWLDTHPDALLLVLDGVEDPRNLGACLRTADAAGAAVIVPRSRTAALGGIARKTASGALETVPLFEVANLARALSLLTDYGVRLYGAADDGDMSWDEPDYRGAVALLVGGEAQGLRRLTRAACDAVVTIPMAGSVDSLNLSVACGVLLYEAIRQRSTEIDPPPEPA